MVEVVNKVSGGWLANYNFNRDKLNYFYWLLAGLSMVNFGAYLLCSSWYRYKKVEVQKEGTSNRIPREKLKWEHLKCRYFSMNLYLGEDILQSSCDSTMMLYLFQLA